ncbi:amidohydrolase [Millisia brevis]|uniref:amidohydrolase n=1 Tax=Millisia brevis TaxID=264148 RepID=UPI00082B74F3|nr:amidohydrolase [Millisia brevis]
MAAGADANRVIERAVERVLPEAISLSHTLHANPETAFEEYASAALVADLLAGHGFEVTRGIVGVPTAFDARIGDGGPTIAFCAEYDALPGIGHACGHNVIAATSAAAGIALAAVAADLDVTVRVIGTPAEESGGGKVVLLERGVFDGVGMAAMVHPAPRDVVDARSLALDDIVIRLGGLEAHASAAPYLGRNAADAATLGQVAVGLLRQHLLPDQQVHGIVTNGGVAPNIIPASSELAYYLRAGDRESLAQLWSRIDDCYAGAARATGCTHEIHRVCPTYHELTADPWLVESYRTAILARGRSPLPPDRERVDTFGSTDMGNITNVLPGIHPLIGIDAGGAVLHQPAFADAVVGPSANAAIEDGAIALAVVAAAAAADPRQREKLLRPASPRPGDGSR